MKSLFASLTIMALSLPLAAHADTTVDPNRRNTKVRLEAERIVRPSVRVQSTTSSIGARRGNEPVYRYHGGCKIDAETGLYGCRDVDPVEPDDGDEPELTEGDILNAVREIGLPSLRVQIQPGDETLVNVPTIFYTEPQEFARSIDLLGFDIDLTARPASFRWVHGDGTARSTARPGRPYPALDVTHRYRTPADGVRARVDVTYRVRYRVDGGAWQALGQTLVASGPTAALDVKEAAPVLTAP